MKTNGYIVVCSDNHGKQAPLKELQNRYQDAIQFLHCGDSDMLSSMLSGYASVEGNNDWFNEFPVQRIIELAGHRILLIHGHRHIFWYDFSKLAEYAKSLDCDVCCFGHTHCYFDDTIDGVRMLNPGSLNYNRDGSGPTYMIVEFKGKEILATKHFYKET